MQIKPPPLLPAPLQSPASPLTPSHRRLRPPAPAPAPLRPYVQRFIVRIIFMVPMYSICSFPSLLQYNQAIYWNTVRDWCASCHCCR